MVRTCITRTSRLFATCALVTKPASKVPSDYSRFICIPARTHDGQANICHRHVTGKLTCMRLHFDPGTGDVWNTVKSVNRVREEHEYLVITAGESVTDRAKTKLEEWARRPKFVAAALPVTSTIKRTVDELSPSDDEPITCGPTAPRRRRIIIDDCDE